MMVTDRMKIPMHRIPAWAKATGTDPHELLGHCLEAYQPALYVLISSLAPSMLVASKEWAVISAMRSAGLCTSPS